ncbi:MAG: class I SAM-dependent methyltransferase [Ginsengibacter sp.]
MPALPKLPGYFSSFFFKRNYQSAESAYDLWAENYDNQPNNLMLAWDEEIFSALLNSIDLKNKTVTDVGCGTGRHWQKIFDKMPQRFFGYDVSEGMLRKLNEKFPQAETHLLSGNKLSALQDECIDCILSTLTIAHIQNAGQALREWNRVLKPGGVMIITDYHPSVLAKGGKRTFAHHEKTIAIKNYVHTIGDIKGLAKQLHLQVSRLVEKPIDESAKHFYEAQNAMKVYDAWKGTPVIYGILLKKENAAM